MLYKTFKNIDEANADETEIEEAAYIIIGNEAIMIERQENGFEIGFQGQEPRLIPSQAMTIGQAANAATMAGF